MHSRPFHFRVSGAFCLLVHTALAAGFVSLAAAPASAGDAGAASRYQWADAHLSEPFWNSRTVYGEAVLPLKAEAGAPAEGTLLLAPQKILRVRSADGKTVYREGVDYTVDPAGRKIVLTPESHIPSLEAAALYKRRGEPHALAHKQGDPETFLMHQENGFPRLQVEVDYSTVERWNGYRPDFAGSILPKTSARLKARQGLRVCLTGDSISAGANASRTYAPYMPAYPELFRRGLQEAYDCPVELELFAVGGATAKLGVDSIEQMVAKKPDLVVVAFGMNDTATGRPDRYRQQISTIVESLRAKVPDVEFILVSTSLANPDWSWSPATAFPKYREAILELAGPGVAVADVTALWTDLLKRKRYHDLTGNGINHPNDYGHRLYAETLLGLLVPSPAAGAPAAR